MKPVIYRAADARSFNKASLSFLERCGFEPLSVTLWDRSD